MLDEIDRSSKKCHERLQDQLPDEEPTSPTKYREILDEIGNEFRLKEDLSYQERESTLEKYADLREQVQDEILDTKFSLLLEKSFLFLQGTDNLGSLAILNKMNLTISEREWIKYSFALILFWKSFLPNEAQSIF